VYLPDPPRRYRQPTAGRAEAGQLVPLGTLGTAL
jgi:hypothetical protein